MMNIRKCAKARNHLAAVERQFVRAKKRAYAQPALFMEQAQRQREEFEQAAAASLVAAGGVTAYCWWTSKNNGTRLEEAEITTVPDFGTTRQRRNTTLSIVAGQKALQTSDASSSKTNRSAPQDRYHIEWSRLLGRGSYGSVHLATDSNTGERVAMKRIDQRATNSVVVHQEIDALQTIQKLGGHQNIVGFRDFYRDGDFQYLVLDLVEGGELYDDLIRNGIYSEREATCLMRQLGSTLDFLHSNRLVHGDLKPENVLLANDDQCGRRSGINIKLIDFGCSTTTTTDGEGATHCCAASSVDNTTTSGGTFAYWPPERFSEDPQSSSRNSSAADMWSAGIILHILLVGHHPFDPKGNVSDDEIRDSIRNCQRVELPSHLLSEEVQDVLSRLLHVDPKQRMTAAELQRHPWIVRQEQQLSRHR
mmetsp:Transcript_22555/g.51896  ORF Transcript_22555/g.51896 Transcript_22555/m.51896 type:complete len:421 (-) Transcript_22555:88-1350(-)